MSAGTEHQEIALPPGTQEVLGVYRNGVELQDGEDYDVLADRIRLHAPFHQEGQVTAIGKLLLSVGIGVYPKGDTIDLRIRRGGRTDVLRGRPL